MATRSNAREESITRDSQAYWNKRAATFTRNATSDYERWLLDLLALKAGEEILDMGCATGTLAVPLARSGHRVHGCDFAEAMLAILDERAAAENLPITSHLLAWEDDWEEAGLGHNSVDVAFASRSLMSGNVFSAVRKLDAAARSRAAVVVPDSLLPSRDPRLLTYLGRSARHPRVVREVIRVLASLGRIPIFATTRTFRPMRFSSFDEAPWTFVAWPAPSLSPRASSGFSTPTQSSTSCVRMPPPPRKRQGNNGSWTTLCPSPGCLSAGTPTGTRGRRQPRPRSP